MTPPSYRLRLLAAFLALALGAFATAARHVYIRLRHRLRRADAPRRIEGYQAADTPAACLSRQRRSWQEEPMLAYGIFAGMAVGGYLGAPGWIVLLGAAAVLSEGWGVKLIRLRQQPRMPWSSKTTTYFATGILAGIAVATAVFWAGRLVRHLAG